MKNFRLIYLVSGILFLGNAANARSFQTDSLSELKNSRPYNDSLPQTFPAFTYQSVENPDLTRLRTKYRLDAVAGSGRDIDRAINLLSWFHDQVPHQDVKNIAVLTAESVIETYRKTKYAQGCYGLAISMNEIF